MLNMVLHTLSIYLIVLSEGSTQRGQVFVLMLYFWNYNYHFRHIGIEYSVVGMIGLFGLS